MHAMPAMAEEPHATPRRRSLVATFRGIIRLYFRRIERVGEPPGPDTRGRVFVSNHHNALIDPVLVLTDAQCEITSPFAALRWLDAYWERTPEPTADQLTHLARLRITARTAIDEARSRL